MSRPSFPLSYFWLRKGVWALLAAVAGYFLWQIGQYWRRLLRQPRLAPLSLAPDLATHETIAIKAAAIAARNLQDGIEERLLPNGRMRQVLCAGWRHFREPWARDFGFAGFGLLELGLFQAMRESLETFFIFQRPSGQFPVKIHSTGILDRYLHSLLGREQPIHIPLRPKYITAHNTISLDGNALLAIAASAYIRQTGDEDFGQQYWPAIRLAIHWMEKHALQVDHLLHQDAFTDWADSIGRSGRILYTNVLYWKALRDLTWAAGRVGKEDEAGYYQHRARLTQRAINDHFWRDDLGYFVTSQHYDNLSGAGNLLAIAWELATPEQAHAILDQMAAFSMANPVPTQVVNRHYPKSIIALENRLAGIAHYHTRAAWLWIGSWHVIALARSGRLAEAEELLHRMSRVIVRDGVVHEVYDLDSRPLSTFWYTSEAPLTWSAGMFVHAYHVYRRHRSEKRETRNVKRET